MATLNAIKRRIKSVKGTQQITNAMNMVSAAKLRHAQENIINARPYAFKMKDVLNNIAAQANPEVHPLLRQREIKKICYIVVAGDRGLCGGFNTNVFRETEGIYRENRPLEQNIVTVGKKTFDYFKRRDYQILFEYIQFFRTLQFSDSRNIIKRVLKLYLDENLDKIVVVYNEFKSVVQQNIIVEQLLPFVPEEVNEEKGYGTGFLYEPSPEKIMDTLLPLHLNVQMWRILLESNAAEQAARMVAMESATENAQEMIEKLTLQFNRTRQQAITTELTEIVGGVEALK